MNEHNRFRIVKWDRRRYQVINPSKGIYRLVRVIGEYDNRDQAYEDMYRIIRGQKTEEEVMEQKLKNYWE
ncbi:MAG TPA: hypothetical protein VIL22_06465 [Paenibacillaceae bacterium]